MKTLLTYLGIILILVAVYAFGGVPAGQEGARDTKSNFELHGEVVFIPDGDTIRTKITKTDVPTKVPKGTTTPVRLIGVDAPEIDWDNNTSDCFGRTSRQYLKNLLKNESVRLVNDKNQPIRDKYGRLLAYVYKDGQNINRQLLAGGYAREFTVGSTYELQEPFLQTAAEARRKTRGLWKKCQ